MSNQIDKEFEQTMSKSFCIVNIHLRSGSVIKMRNYRNALHSLIREYEHFCKDKVQGTYSYYLQDRTSPNNMVSSAEVCINFENVEAIIITEIEQ